MTDIAKSWVTTFLCMIGLCLLIGCGAEEEAAVYDTAANPHGFPTPACDMLDAIEVGRLATYDLITEAFGRLYLENQELLENRHWQEVIKQLGRKFHSKADKLSEHGVRSYSQAAGFYILAAFANPNDAQLSEKAQLFTAWKDVIQSLDAVYACSPTSEKISHRLDFLRHFILGDTLQRAFAHQFLVHQLLDSILSAQPAATVRSLPVTHRAFLAYLALSDPPADERIDFQSGTAVDLIAYRVVAVSPNRWRAELYLVPRDAIEYDHDMILSHGGSMVDSAGETRHYNKSVKFDPIDPTSTWKAGQVYVASTVFAHEITPTRLQFYLQQVDTGSGSQPSSQSSLFAPIDLIVEAEMPCAD